MSTRIDRNDDKNQFIVSTPNVEHINGKSPVQEIVSTLNELVSAAKEYPRQEAERYFELGCVLAKSSSGLTVREMGKLLNLHTSMLGRSKTVAMRLDCDKEKFFEILDRRKTWQLVEREVMPPKKKDYKNLLAKAFKNVRTIAGELKKNPSDTDASASLSTMRDMLNRIFPPSGEIFDKNYLLYYPCAACGAEPAGESHNIKIHHRYSYLRYPLCKACEEEANPPNMTRVAAMYANYAITTEQAYYKIMDYG